MAFVPDTFSFLIASERTRLQDYWRSAASRFRFSPVIQVQFQSSLRDF